MACWTMRVFASTSRSLVASYDDGVEDDSGLLMGALMACDLRPGSARFPTPAHAASGRRKCQENGTAEDGRAEDGTAEDDDA
ncbi:hypothetical protein rosag_09640 [Roseisolibacter agri]|uniref:Uncharacterized protein n=1 Tax=Roseisolibacter agri TaxID=2014610 RepID=A0AA37Q7J7_9BACT|nr:hypothetical protein rosag_09640 [Roseisolibacter agri]